MGMIDKILLLYICISIAVAFWQPNIIFDTQGNDTITTFFNLDYNTTTNTPNLPSCTGNACMSSALNFQANQENATLIEKVFNQLSTASNFFIDALNNVLSFFKVIFRIIFAPWIVFTSPSMQGLPSAVFYIIAVPLSLLLLIGFINWVRSGIT